MKNTISFIAILCICALTSASLAQSSAPLPVFPQSRSTQRAEETGRAKKLYALLRQENRALQWDNCLGAKASMRARELVKKGYFAHVDPETGDNPVWKTVSQCTGRHSKVHAGENLSKGIDSSATPADIHQALMASPTHRKNILDRRFNRVGVGCYDTVCVELFVGK